VPVSLQAQAEQQLGTSFVDLGAAFGLPAARPGSDGMAAQHPSRRTPALLRYIQKHARRVSGAADGQQLGADDWSEGKPSASGNSELFEELPEQPVPEAPGWGTPRLRQPERASAGLACGDNRRSGGARRVSAELR